MICSEKHAYLIIAHNEFVILHHLIRAIDDYRNDIYVHFDAKLKSLPQVQTNKANLYIISNCIDVRWGDYSQIEVEMKLFGEAYNSQERLNVRYKYYHLLSGVDIPLKTQDYIHDFFDKNAGREFLGFYQGNVSKELKRKVGVYHPFPKHFSKVRKYSMKSLIRTISVRLQLAVGGSRNKDIQLVRGTNWCSVTNEFVSFLLSRQGEIKKRFQYTFCADEVYKHTLCWNSCFRANVYDITNESRGCMREINWIVTADKSWLPSFVMGDYLRLKDSDALYARKFDEDNIDVVHRILSDITL